MDAPVVSEVADGVFFAEGRHVNWTLLVDGSAVTLVDAGYPKDGDAVRASLRAVGRSLGDVAAVLITHAHVDHIGGLRDLLAEREVPVYGTATEARHARREFLQQAKPADVFLRCWRPRVLRWAVDIARCGAMTDAAVPGAAAFPGPDVPGEPLPVPGAPVPVPTPGHTSGHCCYLLPAAGVLLSGDALVTAHPTTSVTGPHLLPDFFSHDPAQTARGLAALSELDAGLLLPGHGPVYRGPVYRGPVADAVARARG